MSKSSKNQLYNEPKTIIQKLIDRKREELLVNIAADISGNKAIDLSNNIQPLIEPLIENTIITTTTNEHLLIQKLDLLKKIRKNCIQLNLYHNSRYHYYRILLFTIFRIPLIFLSGLNSFFAVGMQAYITQSSISLINALLSLFCGVLTGIEILLNLQKRMETELDSYKKYYKLSVEIYKEIQVYEKEKDVDMESIDKILNRIYNEYQSNVLSGNAITIYNRIYTDEFEDLEENNEYKHTNNLITNLYYAINHPCSICGVSTSRNMCLSLRDCLCCRSHNSNGNVLTNSS
uniref:Uncharacterized protein n=1 Tax=viral metagenome TaxID=1070528 RepID=A0A6C0DE43_9ZZZZ